MKSQAAAERLDHDLNVGSADLLIESVDDADLDLDIEMSADERARLRAVIAESDAAYARGESVPAEVLFEDIDRIFTEG